LICDDIQVGCGRTGPFFSFERAGIVPDIVTLSKSIGGIGFPMSLVLMKRELDAWEPGQHTGTFRGNQLAFVAAQAALDYFVDQRLEASTQSNEQFLQDFLTHEVAPLDPRLSVRGLGMIWGIDCSAVEDGALARRVANRCFDAGLIIECAGRNDNVIKVLPPLTIEESLLEEGCRIIKQAMSKCLDDYTSPTILSTLQLQPVVEVP
jgi:diaminobutyrate-2-oxoglutarate transaminase